MVRSKNKAGAAAATATAMAAKAQERLATETASKKAVAKRAQASGKLHTPWTLYYHSPEDKDWSTESYTAVATFDTIDGFWELHNALPEFCMQFGMFFLMRRGVQTGSILTVDTQHKKLDRTRRRYVYK